MSNLRGKKLLDFGCGLGDASVYFALQGAHVTGIDISPKTLNIANNLALKYKVNINFLLSKSDNLHDISDNQYDYIYGNGVLHHIDVKKYYPEFSRVLKRGGKAFFIEPIKYNPIINIYRNIATTVRSKDETPIGKREIELAKDHILFLVFGGRGRALPYTLLGQQVIFFICATSGSIAPGRSSWRNVCR